MVKKFKARKVIPSKYVRTQHRIGVVDMKWELCKGESEQARRIQK